uniref:Peptidyl-prolyl cis-trans isomerase n=1 Tax=Ascaris suum TaxID=6253 RepID=F1LCF0_ASCSU
MGLVLGIPSQLLQPFDKKKRRILPYSALNPRVYFLLYSEEGDEIGLVTFRLSAHILPKICENFRSLCTGEKESDLGFEYTYKGTHLHLINRNQKVLVGGDIVNRNGSGGYSIYGRSFDDKPKQIDYHRRGVLFMLTQGAKSNKVDSQFFICLDIPKATNDGIAFGYVEEGLRVLESVLQYGDANGVPRKKIVIYDCGQL